MMPEIPQFFPNFFPSCCVGDDVLHVHRPRSRVSPRFQFFPSCCTHIPPPPPTSSRWQLSILSQLLPALVAVRLRFGRLPRLSILSQLLPEGEGRERQGGGEGVRRGFQFFPSCCLMSGVSVGHRDITALSILSQLLRTTFLRHLLAHARRFQFFPSCCRAFSALLPFKPFFR
jgi:hypothetical protein